MKWRNFGTDYVFGTHDLIREGGKRGTHSGVEISGGKCSKSNEAEKAGEHIGENMARGREEKKKERKNTIQSSNSFTHQNALNVMYTPSTSTSMYSNIYSEIVHKRFLFFWGGQIFGYSDTPFCKSPPVFFYFSNVISVPFFFFNQLIQFQCSSNRSSTYIKKVQFQVKHVCVKFTIQIRHLNAKFTVRESLFGRHSVAWPHSLNSCHKIYVYV